MEHHAHVLIGGVWRHRLPNWRDAAALILVMAVFALIGTAIHQLAVPWVAASAPVISLSPAALPLYALRTTARMMVALVASLVFTLIYATVAAKSRRAEAVLIPLLDVLQSVPILGYLSFTVVFFVSLFPGSVLGLELAAIF
ncbi:MAG: sulfonate ABC transporter permease, partial [Steroidobacteraceae bacterium]